MKTSTLLFLLSVGVIGSGCRSSGPPAQASEVAPLAGENHFANIRQLTFGGQNAEAYFSADGRRLTFQASTPDMQCDQQFVMRLDGSERHRISTGCPTTLIS